MGAVTYPDEKVTRFINENFIPVQILVSNTILTDKYVVKWTPTILVVDGEGKEHYRTVGFFAPDDLIGAFMTGKGRWHLDADRYQEAQAVFEEVQAAYPGSEAAAEAIFFNGVNQYKMSHDPKFLRYAYDLLTDKYPASSWTKQASVYRLIDK